MSAQDVKAVSAPNNQKSKFGIRLAYSLGDAGFSFMWGVVSSFVTLYYTDSVGLSAAFAGTMMLICRLFDGLSDIVAGSIIEKTRSKMGKCRFWLAAAIVPLAISMILMFSVPANLTIFGKQIYAVVTYIFMTVICFTMANIAYNSLLSRFTLSADDVVSVSTMRVVLAIGTSMLVGMSMVSVLNLFGGISDLSAWRTMAIIFTAIGFTFQLITTVFVKERNTDPEPQTVEKKEKRKVGPLFAMVLKDVNFWIILIEFACVNIITFASINAYYARDVLGDVNLVGTMTLASMGPVIVLQFVLPTLVRKIGKRNCLLIGGALLVVMGVLITAAPFSAGIVLAALAIGGFGRGIFMGLIYTLIADLVDYFKEKNGEETEGICYSTTSIGTKVGAGLATAIVGWVLQFGHYDASLAVQTLETQNAMARLMGFGNLAIGIVMFLGVWMLTLGKKKNVESAGFESGKSASKVNFKKEVSQSM